MATTLTINGSSVSLARNQLNHLVAFARGGYPTLTLTARTGILPTSPDPWLTHEAVLTISGTVRFKGDVVAAHPHFGALGWEVQYQCLGLKHRGDRFPLTDSITGIDTSGFNIQPEDPNYNAARAGRTVGQIVSSILTMDTNAQNLTARSIGGITGSVGSYTLPSDTTTDLAALTIIPPAPVQVKGEKFLSAIESFLGEWAPNYLFWIDPSSGHIRVLDTRTFTNHTFTLGTDPVSPSELSRDITDCYQRIQVRGQPIAVMSLLKLSLSQITENFGHDGLSNSAAKSAWSVNDWKTPAKSTDTGTVTCTSTTTLTYTSSNGSQTFASGILDQAHQQATVQLSSTIVTDYTQFWSARITAQTALTAGSTMNLTIDAPMPHTSFDKATISFQPSGGVVWTQYAIANTNLWSRVAPQSTYPQAFVNSGGGVTLLSSALGLIKRSDGVTAPLPFTVNTATGNIKFVAPTYIVGNNAAPSDVWAYLPIWTNPNTATYPADISGVPQYAGTSHSVDGMSETLIITMESWRDPAQLSQVQTYAQDLLDSVKDAVIEGTLTYHGLYDTALTPGTAASVTGSDYTTGWESAALPVIGVELEWPAAGPTSWVTTLHCSNRRGHLNVAAFLKPERRFLAFGGEGQPFGEGLTGAQAAFQQSTSRQLATPGGFGANVTAPTGLNSAIAGIQGDLGTLGGGLDSYAPGDLTGWGPGGGGAGMPGMSDLGPGPESGAPELPETPGGMGPEAEPESLH